MSEVLTSQVQWRIPTWFTDLSQKQLELLKGYLDILLKFNKTINLVSTKTLPFADIIHFSDSIMACRVVYKNNSKIKSITDIGSGNGFPGIVFAILFPEISVVLVDSDSRKIEFLKSVISSLHLKNASVYHGTVESMPENSIDFAITRGFASISKTVFALRKIVKPGGVVYHLKGDEWANEISDIPAQLCSLWTPGLLAEYKLPVGPSKLNVVKTEKVK